MTQWVASATQAEIRVDGPGIFKPLVLTAPVSNQASASLAILGVPAGNHRVVTLHWLDALGARVPSGALETTVDIPASGDALARIGHATTPRGLVFERLLAADRTNRTHLAEQTDPSAVQSLIDRVVAQTDVAYPDLVDAGGIATAIIATGQVPAFDARFGTHAAALDVTLEGVPGVAPASVWVDDPLSPKNVSLVSGTHRITSIVPGTWTVHARSDRMAVEATASVTLASGQWATASFNLGAPPNQVQASMPVANMASGYGVVTLNGQAVLLSAGGVERATGSVGYHDQVWAFDGANWIAQSATLSARCAYGAAVASGSDYYLLGAVPSTATLSSSVYRFNGGSWTSVAPMPEPRASAALAWLGNSLYVVGGFHNPSWGSFGAAPPTSSQHLDDFNAAQTLRYDFAGGTWSTMPAFANLPVARGDMPAAVVGGRLYVFGGYQFSDAAAAYYEAPVADVSSMDASGTWRKETALPTPRAGAAAIVVNGKVYVIGGCIIGGIPVGSVEVYDPASETWAIKAPLRKARGYLSAGLIQGRIVVAGGGDGGSTGLEGIPVDTVESFVP